MWTTLVAVVALPWAPAPVSAQAGSAAQSVEPFKLGTFGIDGEEKVGVVLRDAFVVDLEEANAAMEEDRSYPAREMPDNMVDLIAAYENGLRERIYALVNDIVGANALTGNGPDYVYEVGEVDTKAPIPQPRMIMNTAVNFYSHIAENAPDSIRQRMIQVRRENRGSPYMFLKAPSSVIGNNDTIYIPWGRDELDWEVELATIMGAPARYVAATEAQAHIFGYTVMLDISDRGGRPPGGFSSGTDWFLMKGQDTFGPMGPWIVPKEFYGNPMEELRQTLLVGDQQMQQATASDMIHSVGEVIEYASSLVTIMPGDIIGTGTSGGVGMGTSVRGEQVWLVDGDEITATIDGIGSLHMYVRAAPPPPPGTGAYLPPNASYDN
jgi:2-keto-4-pentenoate hydratase/2-oxohepta-3-ene-1,7-dioic acid hydratase in catechol pathway